jgi:anthranilate phosphoribosyltransferase
VFHGADGLDELTTTTTSTVHELADGALRRVTVDPLDFGLTRASAADLRGADAATNAQAVRAVLAGEKGPHRDIALLNAAAALVVAGLTPDLAAGIDAAAASIDSGQATGALAELVRVSQDAAAEEADATT